MSAQTIQDVTDRHGHRFDAGRRWEARLSLGFRHDGAATRLHRVDHRGPLRVQRPFYPEGRDGTCHVYLLHPPGGLVSGDALDIQARVARGASALLTTPAANKLYRADSNEVSWSQRTRLVVEPGASLEWLPQETIAFDGSRGRQSTEIELHGDARCLGWEVLALGRPASDLPFASGYLEQSFRLARDGQPLWIERQPLDPLHRRFSGAWGQRGCSVQATLWAVGLDDGAAAVEVLREQLAGRRGRTDDVVDLSSPSMMQQPCAVTLRDGVLLLRYLGHSRHEAWTLCEAAWKLLRPMLLERTACPPRIWFT
ncbi:urease accessory protein UreD [Halomonas denitrificans]|uniref:urease accessory protein UreD n=1 Tax=Halomonas denitrificans TaxID=370769 RepID=UPI001C9996DC|nr:urease accessory protein UreD [Halomonas denitrificans]MBY5968912.1 urease accessory protein UreD [Halomonas denitrificans]